MQNQLQPRNKLDKSLEWCATGLAVVGAILLALKLDVSGWAFILYLISTVTFSIVFLKERRWSMLVLNLVFVATNMVGIYRWLIA